MFFAMNAGTESFPKWNLLEMIPATNPEEE
jgi:hypothetical protein